jgi:choline-sulfatase
LRGDKVCDEALTTLRSLKGKRFFLWVHFYDPHYPYLSDRGADPASPAGYADEVAFVDTQIGRLLSGLKSVGVEGKTLVVAVGDHGEGLGEHQEAEHGYFVYETTMHVPLLIWAPGTVPGGKVIDGETRTIDLVPTILDYLQLPPDAQAQGVTLRPAIDGKTPDLKLTGYGETFSPQEVLGLSPLRCLYQETWKYTLAPKPELYNVRTDPQEQNNEVSARAQDAARMREDLRKVVQTAPPAAPNAQVGLTQEEAELFRSLGYIAGSTAAGEDSAGADEAFEPSGGNPADFAEAIDLYNQSHRATADHDWAKAEALLRPVVRDIPGAPNPLRDLSLALNKQGRQAEFLPLLEQVLQEEPDATTLRVFYAGELMAARRPEDAVAQLKTAALKDPGSAEAHFQLGNGYRALGRNDEAYREYGQALKLAPRDTRVLHGMAMLEMKQNRLPLAAEHLKQAVEIQPQSAQLKQALRKVLEQIKSGGAATTR